MIEYSNQNSYGGRMLSVILITKNEIKNIQACLESIKWADEIIVVDSGSTDGTQAVCQQFGCKLVHADWQGFGIQKQRALDLASHDWVLSIDADERVSDELKQEILGAIQQSEVDAYELPRSSSYCGKFIKHSGWTPDYVLRLFKREKAQFTEDLVHERIVVQGDIERLTNPLIHYSFDNLEQVLSKVDQYSTLAAQQMYDRGKRSTIGKALLRGFWAFIRTYFLRRGVLDGKHGLMLAISNAEGTYYKYAKLALLSEKK